MTDTTTGFIMTRHVNSEETNRYWQTAYAHIRAIYPHAMVLVIDDNSDYSFVRLFADTPALTDFTVIQSEFPGCGELLAYYYFWRIRPFSRAVIIHDSVFIQPSFAPLLNSVVHGCRFLWHFPHFYDNALQERALLFELPIDARLKSDVLYLHSAKQEWLGMFGVLSVMDYGFLDMLQQKYRMFDAWMPLIKGRNERYWVERTLAVLCCIEDRQCCRSLLGDIYEWPHNYHFNWRDFVTNRHETKWPVVKVWSGR